MSRVIPPFTGEGTVSEGERKVFRAFQNLSDNYVILHSLGLANHKHKVFGEIDFVVICREGILCLEVKGGQVFRRDGIWYFVDREGNEGKSNEGPFKQVLRSMYSLHAYMKKHFAGNDPLVRCQYACGVIFPDIPFTQKDPEIISEIIFDARKSEAELEKYIKQVFDYWRCQLREKHGFEGDRLSPSQIEKAADYLRGNFGFVPSLDFIIKNTEERLLVLTQEQVDRLAMIGENPRLLVKGGAGTGKTLLSIEHARRCAIQGKKVFFICFNKVLAGFLRDLIQKKSPELVEYIKIQHFHGFFKREIEKQGFELQGEGDDFFRKELPEAFCNTVEKFGFENKYDVLIVDEGQDLLREEYIFCMNEILSGGFDRGDWHICYDYNQNIYNKDFQDGLNFIMEYNPVLVQLDTNCRNTKPIGIYTTLYTGMEPAKYFRVDGEAIYEETYTDFKDERKKLVKIVKRLMSQGVNPGSIAILSHLSFEQSCLQGENIFQGICSFQNITGLGSVYMVENSLKFCTVQSFKGLESSVVIILDIEQFDSEYMRLINYTAMSRAKSLLYIFYNVDAKKELENMVKGSAPLLEKVAH